MQKLPKSAEEVNVLDSTDTASNNLQIPRDSAMTRP